MASANDQRPGDAARILEAAITEAKRGIQTHHTGGPWEGCQARGGASSRISRPAYNFFKCHDGSA